MTTDVLSEMRIAATDHHAVLGYKQLPPEVSEPLVQLLSWLLWFALAGCLTWLILAGGKFYQARRDGSSQGLGDSDGAQGALFSLLGAVVATSATTIAQTLLST